MTSVGTTRRIDRLGRVVIPAELRRSLSIHDGDLVNIGTDSGAITLRKVQRQCVICGGRQQLSKLHTKDLCAQCLQEIRRESA